MRVAVLRGRESAPFLPAVARLRIEVFREFPYIYDGDAGYEAVYLKTYAAAARAVVVLAFDGDKIVGAATCLPLADETANVRAPFTENGIDISHVFYFGESVLLPAYRGLGIGKQFFTAREAHARGFGDYRLATFCAVRRAENHPLRPADFIALDDFWTRRGFTRQPRLICKMSWQDLNDAVETEKHLTFWTKPL